MQRPGFDHANRQAAGFPIASITSQSPVSGASRSHELEPPAVLAGDFALNAAQIEICQK